MTDSKPSSSEWMPAKEALAILSAGGRNPVEIKAMLAEYLRDGHLRARAEAVWISVETDLGRAWTSDDVTAEVERDIIVPTRYWRSDKRALDDRAGWRWPFNKFFYTIRFKPLKRRMFRGVELHTLDLEKLQPTIFNSGRKLKPGPNPDIAARDAGWLAVVKLSLAGRLETSYLNNQNDLIAEIADLLKLSDSRLGEGQIYQIAKQVYRLLKPKEG